MTASDRATELATAAALAASDKLANDVVALDVSDQLVITDVFLVASAPNDRQVRAIVDSVEERLLTLGAKPIRREGHREGRWVLLDYGDLVVHVQHADEREYYSLERLWRDCPAITLPQEGRGRPRGSDDGGSYTDGVSGGGAAAWYRPDAPADDASADDGAADETAADDVDGGASQTGRSSLAQ